MIRTFSVPAKHSKNVAACSSCFEQKKIEAAETVVRFDMTVQVLDSYENHKKTQKGFADWTVPVFLQISFCVLCGQSVTSFSASSVGLLSNGFRHVLVPLPCRARFHSQKVVAKMLLRASRGI